MNLKRLINWAMKQQLRFIKEEEIESFGKAFLNNIDSELGLDESDYSDDIQVETKKRTK